VFHSKQEVWGMMQCESFTHRSLKILCSVGLMAVATGQAAEPAQSGVTAAETSTVESREVGSNAGSDPSPAQGPGVPERLRHKNRAVTVGAPASSSARAQAPGISSSVQHNESDMDFIRESAKGKTPPQHTPEWTNAKGADPGHSDSAKQGGTADINIGVGENLAAEGDTKDD
jgi:hypothetical protein